jgi:hypothetical protein
MRKDWMSKKSSAPNYGNTKIKKVAHSFDYRESNRKIGIDFGATALMPKTEGHDKCGGEGSLPSRPILSD